MTNKIIKIKKELKNNIIGSLLLGSFIAAITQVQASQRHSQSHHSSPPKKETQENREKDKEMVGISKEEAKKLLQEGHEAVRNLIKTNAKRREQERRLRRYHERIDYLRKSQYN
jgi:hypothetical protein